MNINLIVISSELHILSNVLKARTALFEGLRAFGRLTMILENDYINNLDKISQAEGPALNIIFIATGGTEEKFLNIFPYLSQPVIILSDGYHNSFAASFEICTWLKNNNIEHYMFHAPDHITPESLSGLKNELIALNANLNARKVLSGLRVGLIGGASSWLISSWIDRESVIKKIALNFIDISSTEVIDRFKEIKASGKDYSQLADFKQYLSLLKDRSKDDLTDAYILYDAIKSICDAYKLDALTIKCFDLLDTCHSTACLALALLNDNGIVAGCEGDIPTLCTMLFFRRNYNACCFMANPAAADKEHLTADFAHCSIPLTMTDAYRLPSHFESRMGIGIQGSVPPGEYTLLKISGLHLDKRYYCCGDIIETPYIAERCRTQVRFKFRNMEDFDNFMANRVGNHIVIAKGNFVI